MKKLKLFLSVSILSMGFVSCGDGGGATCDDLVQNGGLALTAEIQAFTDASIAYSIDQSDANCQKYLSTLRNYIDSIKDLQDCAEQVGQGAEFAASIREAETNIGELSCN